MNFDVKSSVKELYGSIAKEVSEKSNGCGCTSSCCSSSIPNRILYDSNSLNELPQKAVEASLGCANPLLFANLKEGETVLDLGSGGGIDVFLASNRVGKPGKVYGLDMTDEMLELANANKQKMGVENVEFIKGYIEDIPLPDKSIDVIMSNCVINLSEDKTKALSEAFRVLKDNGRLAIADIVTLRQVPEEIRRMAAIWSSCLGGALTIDEYRQILETAGFENIEIEPVHTYTKSVILDTLKSSSCFEGLASSPYLDEVDGAFAGALIKAFK